MNDKRSFYNHISSNVSCEPTPFDVFQIDEKQIELYDCKPYSIQIKCYEVDISKIDMPEIVRLLSSKERYGIIKTLTHKLDIIDMKLNEFKKENKAIKIIRKYNHNPDTLLLNFKQIKNLQNIDSYESVKNIEIKEYIGSLHKYIKIFGLAELPVEEGILLDKSQIRIKYSPLTGYYETPHLIFKEDILSWSFKKGSALKIIFI